MRIIVRGDETSASLFAFEKKHLLAAMSICQQVDRMLGDKSGGAAAEILNAITEKYGSALKDTPDPKIQIREEEEFEVMTSEELEQSIDTTKLPF